MPLVGGAPWWVDVVFWWFVVIALFQPPFIPVGTRGPGIWVPYVRLEDGETDDAGIFLRELQRRQVGCKCGEKLSPRVSVLSPQLRVRGGYMCSRHATVGCHVLVCIREGMKQVFAFRLHSYFYWFSWRPEIPEHISPVLPLAAIEFEICIVYILA